MSSGRKLPYSQVFPLAQKIVARLAPACTRIEMAGSLRRHRPQVSDIELVAIPRFERPVLGVTPADRWGWSAVDHLLAAWDSQRLVDITLGDKLRGKARKYVQFVFRSNAAHAYTVDLFLQPDPATWGMNLLIRTGSSEFSRRMVTRRSQGGLMPDEFRLHEALVWQGQAVIPTLEEQDVFALWGMDFVRPEERR